MSDNVQKVQELYAAFGRGDVNAIVANMAADVTWGTDSEATEVPWYPIRKGPEQVADFFATVAREVEFSKFAPTSFAVAGDEVIVCIDMDYKLRKNGRGAALQSLHRLTVRDGKVTKYRAYEDTAAVRAAWNGE